MELQVKIDEAIGLTLRPMQMAVVNFFTLNGLFLIMPIMNRSLVRKHYENMGWKITSWGGTDAATTYA